jgi:SNF2 family DNA or RNA helicase
MSVLSSGRRSVVAHLLRRVAPFSIIDSGARLAAEGTVVECSRTGQQIRGIVRVDQTLAHAIQIELPGGDQIEGRCTCSSGEEMQEQWCAHAVALLLRAADLGFTEPGNGFAPGQGSPSGQERGGYPASRNPADKIADVLATLAQTSAQENTQLDGEIRCRISFNNGRCAVQLQYNGNILEPALLEGNHRPFKRELYNILTRTLEDGAQWSEELKAWLVGSSEGISVILGLLNEEGALYSLTDDRTVTVSEEPLDAKLSLLWRADGVDLSLLWILPDGSEQSCEDFPVGTGPAWTMLDDTIFRLTERALALTEAFPGDGSIFVQKAKVGSLLVALSSHESAQEFVQIKRPELQPETSIVAPSISVTVEKSERGSDHFASQQQQLELRATVQFEYPAPPSDKNVVYLPDRQREEECYTTLRGLGFQSQSDDRSFLIRGDSALDLLHAGPEALPADWSINGLTQIRRAMKFANLSVKVSLGDGNVVDEPLRDRPDWFECDLSLLQNNSPVPLAMLFKNARADSDRWVRLDSGAFARVPGGGLNQLKTTLGLLDMNFKLSSGIHTRISPAQAISLARFEDDQIEVQSSTRLKSLAKKLKDFTSITPVKLSKEFNGKLRSYQHEGVNWLNFLSEFSLGGILADEMGLGKTVQTLAYLQANREKLKKDKKTIEPTLIVAPTSVITNWAYEARRFTPNLSVLLLHGPNRKQQFEKLPKFDIVITSYALLRLDRFDLEKVQFSYLILDEAQNIKNPQAATTLAAKALKSRHRLALTGTPTENRPLELWSILDFLMPGYLGSADFFRSYIEKPIIEIGPHAPVTKLLNQRTRPFILRRAKAEVEKDLPPKIESVLHVDMTESQRQLYNQIIADVRPKVFDAVQKKGMRGASVSILAALLRLRQVCNHPNSIDSLREVHGFDSGKFTLLKDLITEALESGRKILLFCQFLEMLQIIRRWLDQSGSSYLYLDGATKERQGLVDKFNSDDSVRTFLISLKAGGTGLNLTAADTVIIYDPWWNPAVEHQAVDRAHRIGQKKTVSVYRLVTENSVEQKIMDLKSKKSKIVDALIHEPGLSTINLSKMDLESLFEPVEPLAVAANDRE